MELHTRVFEKLFFPKLELSTKSFYCTVRIEIFCRLSPIALCRYLRAVNHPANSGGLLLLKLNYNF